jgi:hypothetical protein
MTRLRRTSLFLAAHQCMSDTKGGKRHHISARLSWLQACELGFHGHFED